MDTLILSRKYFTDKSTIGELILNGEHFCETLEDTCRRQKIPGKTAIPPGRYQVVILPSARYGRNMPRLMNVPGYQGILIHWGNYPADTAGCILVGKYDKERPDFISGSRSTFDRLFDRLGQEKGEMHITISGGFRHDGKDAA